MPTNLPVRIAAGLVLALIVIGLAIWVINPRFLRLPSAAAKLQPKVEKAVAKTQTQQGAAVAKVTREAQAAITDTGKRTDHAVAEIRRTEVKWRTRVVPGPARVEPYPDDDAYRGLCRSFLYAGDPDCRQYRGKPAR